MVGWFRLLAALVLMAVLPWVAARPVSPTLIDDTSPSGCLSRGVTDLPPARTEEKHRVRGASGEVRKAPGPFADEAVDAEFAALAPSFAVFGPETTREQDSEATTLLGRSLARVHSARGPPHLT